MKEYHKIETLFTFDLKTKSFTSQLYNKDVAALQNHQWTFTEKINGTNLRLNWNGHKLVYSGRTDESEFSKGQQKWIEENLVTPAIEQAFEQSFKEKNVIVFGELFGKDIQKEGPLYSPDYKFLVFDILMPISEKPMTHKYLNRATVEKIAEQFGFEMVPIVTVGTIKQGIYVVRTLEKSSIGNAPIEGLVGVPVGDFLNSNGERIIIKIKRRDLPKTILNDEGDFELWK